jgi:hypothetical protein
MDLTLGWATHGGLVGGVGGLVIKSSILMVGVGGVGFFFKYQWWGWVGGGLKIFLTKILRKFKFM